MKKISTFVAALIVTAQIAGGDAQAATLEQLEIIDRYAKAGDMRGLRSYIQANPGLMADGTPLAQELADFVQNPPQRGFLEAIGVARPTVPSGITQSVSEARTSLY